MAHGVIAMCAGLIGQALVGRQLAYAIGQVHPLVGTFPPLTLSFFGFGAAIVKAVAGAASVFAQKRAVAQVGDSVRRDTIERILAIGQPRARAQETHAALVLRIHDVERGVDEGLLTGLRAGLELLPLVAALLVLSSRLALLALVLLLPFALGLAWARRRFRAEHARAARLAERLHAGLDDLVRHVDLWRSFGAGMRIRAALAVSGRDAAAALARTEAARSALSGANEVLAAAVLLAVVAWVDRGGLAPKEGPLVAFFAIFFLVYRPARDLGDARTHLDRGAAALGELDDLVRSLGPEAPDREPSSEPFAHTGWGLLPLRVRDLRAGPPRGGQRLRFDVEPGQIVAIAGPTGSGKTTLLRALLGLELTDEGTIRYGSEDLSRRGVGPSARPFAWVPQEATIVTGTVADNVALGLPAGRAASADAVARQCLAAIGAAPLVLRAHERVSAGGPELSGGERQWIAIARALASELPVLLLDEPTAGLDDEAQRQVLDALAALRGQRMMIVVSHRAEPLQLADRVIELEREHGAVALA